MPVSQTLTLVGLACVIAAVVGGGLKLIGIEIPPLTSFRRQVLLGSVGIAVLAGVGIAALTGVPTSPKSTDGNGPQPPAPTASAPTTAAPPPITGTAAPSTAAAPTTAVPAPTTAAASPTTAAPPPTMPVPPPRSASATGSCPVSNEPITDYKGRQFGTRYYCRTYISYEVFGNVMSSQRSQDLDDTGYMDLASRVWVICQFEGRPNPVIQNNVNTWWLYTQGDHPRPNSIGYLDNWGYLPATAVAQGAQNQPIPGVRTCPEYY
jgi:eukaryotic-like serine/threonine-protein kinase